MRLIKMLGLVAIAAVAAMAFVGASLAMAESSLLCSKDTVLTPTAGECQEPSTVHFISVNGNGELAHIIRLTEVGGTSISIECDLLIQGTVLTGLVTNGPVKIHVAAAGLVYSNCLNGCTFTTEEGGVLEILKDGVELFQVSGTGFKVKTVCFGIKCVYSIQGSLGHGLGPLEEGTNGLGHVTYTEQAIQKISGVCPETMLLDALFKSLTPLYVRG